MKMAKYAKKLQLCDLFMTYRKDYRLFWAQIALAVACAITGPKTGLGCRATPFKYPSLWIQPPRTDIVRYRAI